MAKTRIAIQMDQLTELNKKTDSTLALAEAAAERGFDIFHYEPQHLCLNLSGKDASVTARGHKLGFLDRNQESAFISQPETIELSSFDVILMRQDPPFDLAYIATTHILDHLKDKVRVVNNPEAVRNAPEKLLSTHFPELMPPTLITRDKQAILDFASHHGDVVFKPLFGYAGYGIFRLAAHDGNFNALLEMMASINPEPWMVQKYVKAIQTAGDKRIILLNGEPKGCFTRIPGKEDIRGNMRVGGQPQKTKFTKRDGEICEKLGPLMKAQGLYFVGIDVIGDYLTEINVTSPTGLVMADLIEGRKGRQSLAHLFWKGLGL